MNLKISILLSLLCVAIDTRAGDLSLFTYELTTGEHCLSKGASSITEGQFCESCGVGTGSMHDMTTYTVFKPETIKQLETDFFWDFLADQTQQSNCANAALGSLDLSPNIPIECTKSLKSTIETALKKTKMPEPKISKEAVAYQLQILESVWSKLDSISDSRSECIKANDKYLPKSKFFQKKVVGPHDTEDARESLERRTLTCLVASLNLNSVWNGHTTEMRNFLDYWIEEKKKNPKLSGSKGFEHFVSTALPVDLKTFKLKPEMNKPDSWKGTLQSMVINKLRCHHSQRYEDLKKYVDYKGFKIVPKPGTFVSKNLNINEELKEFLVGDSAQAAVEFMSRTPKYSQFKEPLGCVINGKYGAGKKQYRDAIMMTVYGAAIFTTTAATLGAGGVPMVLAMAGTNVAALGLQASKTLAECKKPDSETLLQGDVCNSALVNSNAIDRAQLFETELTKNQCNSQLTALGVGVLANGLIVSQFVRQAKSTALLSILDNRSPEATILNKALRAANRPIQPVQRFSGAKVVAYEKREIAELEKMGAEFHRSSIPTYMKYKESIESFTDDPYFGSLLNIDKLPEKKGSASGLSRALLHPEMPRYLAAMENLGQKLVVDTSKKFSGVGAYYSSDDKLIAIGSDTDWSMFIHEYQHMEFRALLDKNNISYEALKDHVVKANVSIEEVLKPISFQQAKELSKLEKLLHKGYAELPANERLSVDRELAALGWSGFYPRGFQANIYATKYRIQQLLAKGTAGTLTIPEKMELGAALVKAGGPNALLQATAKAPVQTVTAIFGVELNFLDDADKGRQRVYFNSTDGNIILKDSRDRYTLIQLKKK